MKNPSQNPHTPTPDLASLVGPDDADRRAADLLRTAMHMTSEPQTDAVDPATTTRVLNTLRAEGLFDRPPGSVQAGTRGAGGTPSPSPAGRRQLVATPVLGWRLPGWAWAGLAMLAVAIAWYAGGSARSSHPEELHGITGKSGTSLGNPAVQHVQVRSPEADAAQLVLILSAHGLRAEVLPVGESRVVQALVPPAASQAVATALNSKGFALPHDGRLAIQFEPRQP